VGYVAFLTRSQVSYKEKKEEKEGRKRRMLKDRPVARRLQLALDFRTCLSFLPSNRNPTLTGIGEGRRHLLHCILIPYTLKVAVISEAERQYPKSQAMKERYICEKALPLEREGEEERNRRDWNGLVEKQKHKRRWRTSGRPKEKGMRAREREKREDPCVFGRMQSWIETGDDVYAKGKETKTIECKGRGVD
jgi:hypothetical protein